MTLHLPYVASKQELGETRQAMGKRLMKDLEEIIEMPKCKAQTEKYYVLFHAKPWPDRPDIIKVKKMVIFKTKPSMMLSCLCFGVDNASGVLTLEWSLPGSWPTWAMEGTNEPIPEVISSLAELSKTQSMDSIIAY
jgi:hypothetical protein